MKLVVVAPLLLYCGACAAQRVSDNFDAAMQGAERHQAQQCELLTAEALVRHAPVSSAQYDRLVRELKEKRSAIERARQRQSPALDPVAMMAPLTEDEKGQIRRRVEYLWMRCHEALPEPQASPQTLPVPGQLERAPAQSAPTGVQAPPR